MTWLAWRQFRVQAIIAAIALAVVGIIVIATEPGIAHLYATTVGACPSTSNCSNIVAQFLHTDNALQFFLDVAILFIPGLVGAFWGAPLVAREIEDGTFRMAWTQSVSRTRWLLVKLVVGGLASAVVAGLLSLAVTWWFAPFNHASVVPPMTGDSNALNQFATFDQRGIVPIGYAVFGFAVGVFTGMVVRRTVPAMAMTLVVLVLCRVGVADLVRPNLIAPVVLNQSMTSDHGIGYISTCESSCTQANIVAGPPDLPGAWVVSDPPAIVDAAGAVLSPSVVARECPDLAQNSGGSGINSNRPQKGQANGDVLTSCASKLNATYHEQVTFQPADRYWAFQWAEFGIFVVLAFAVGGAGLWWVRRLAA
jgi:hypothetical protein